MQPYTITVTGYGSGGEGIARLDDGRVIFIRGAARGDVLKVALTKERLKSAQAEIIEIIKPSQYRTTPDCPYYPDCGGCDFRHITYEEELDAKLKRVNDALERIGGLSIRATEILKTGQINGYRNKATFHSDGKSTGFYRSGSHDIINIDRCMLLKDDINAAIEERAYAKLKHQSFATFGQHSSNKEIVLRSGRHGINPPLEEELDGLIFGITGFFQVNTNAALLLYKQAREYASLSLSETLIDMYCGVGSLTLFVGRDAGYALGIEIEHDAVETARDNALHNNISHIDFLCADAGNWEIEVTRLGNEKQKSKLTRVDCIIVDPPRKGLSQGAVDKMMEISPSRIVYISCDPATLARDLKKLKSYTAKNICAVDMFPRTANIECCCLLVK